LVQEPGSPAEAPEPPQGPVKQRWAVYRSWLSMGGTKIGGMYLPPERDSYFKRVVDGSAWPQQMPFKCLQTFADYIWSGSLISYVNQLFARCQHYARLAFRLQNEVEDLQKKLEAAQAENARLNANAGNPLIHMFRFVASLWRSVQGVSHSHFVMCVLCLTSCECMLAHRWSRKCRWLSDS
jgi:hypothetical protein